MRVCACCTLNSMTDADVDATCLSFSSSRLASSIPACRQAHSGAADVDASEPSEPHRWSDVECDMYIYIYIVERMVMVVVRVSCLCACSCGCISALAGGSDGGHGQVASSNSHSRIHMRQREKRGASL